MTGVEVTANATAIGNRTMRTVLARAAAGARARNARSVGRQRATERPSPLLARARRMIDGALDRFSKAIEGGNAGSLKKFPGAEQANELPNGWRYAVADDGRLHVWTTRPEDFVNAVKRNKILLAFRESVGRAYEQAAGSDRAYLTDNLRMLVQPHLLSQKALSVVDGTLGLHEKIGDARNFALSFPVTDSERALSGFPISFENVFSTEEERIAFLTEFEASMRRLLSGRK